MLSVSGMETDDLVIDSREAYFKLPNSYLTPDVLKDLDKINPDLKEIGLTINLLDTHNVLQGVELEKYDQREVILRLKLKATNADEVENSKKDQIQSMTIRNQNIDYEFIDHFYEVFNGFKNIKTLTFDTCNFCPGDFSFLIGLSLTKLAIINSGLTEEGMEYVLKFLHGYTEKELDFSNNFLGKDKDKLNKLIKSYFNGAKFAIKYPVLEGNPVDISNL